MSSQRHLIPDPHDKSDGTDYGGKVALELWLNLGETAWTSIDESYGTARNETAVRWRAGQRYNDWLSVGPELRFDKNIESGAGEWNGRAGIFARYEWGGGEVSVAGGVLSRVDGLSANDIGPYGTISALIQY